MKILGILMLLLILAAHFWVVAGEVGFRKALFVYSGGLFLVGWVCLSAYLIAGG